MINVHGSLLPRYRGASPITAALLNGDAEAGCTIIEVARRMDAGRMLGKASLPVAADETGGSLFEKLAPLGARLLVETIARIEAGTVVREEQDESLATESGKISKADGRVDWSASAVELERRIRAFTPWPGVAFRFGGKRVTVERASPAESELAGEPGELLEIRDEALVVATGAGAIGLEVVKPAGKRAMSGVAFARGRRLEPGVKLENGS